MRIGFFGDGIWAHNSLDSIISDERFEVAFVAVRFDHRDSVLLNKANKNNIPILIEKNINNNRVLSIIKKFECDILVSMSFNQIFKKDIIQLTRGGVINCHAGKLPYYRGRNILNWALINDEKEFGITVHYIDEGIDTGDIIIQRTYEISDLDTYETLLKRAYESCPSLLLDALVKISKNEINPIKQNEIHEYGFYCGRRIEGDEIINWNVTSRELFNFVRAICKPGPQATTFIRGKEFKINKVRCFESIPTYMGVPGQVIGKTENGIMVKTKDTYVELIEYQSDEKIRIGDRFKQDIL